MDSSIVTMARHDRNYLNFSALPSRPKVPPSKSGHLKAFGKHSWQPSHSQLRPRSSTSTSPKTYTDMKNSTTQKRSHSDKPFADSTSDPTGLELVDGPPAKKIHTATTESELEIYNRRKKTSKYADAIRKKRIWAKVIGNSGSQMPSNAQQGMPNFTGNLCYRVSLLQGLLHQPLFVSWIQKYHRKELCVSDSQDTCVSCLIRRLALEYWKGTRSSDVVSDILHEIHALFRTLGWKTDNLHGHADPDEQAAWMFNVMSREMPSSVFGYFESSFQLITTSTICCQKCGYESRTTGHGDQSLPVPIAPKLANSTLSKYVQNYMVEVVHGYKCEKCHDRGNKQRVVLIVHSPNILIVQLKRFEWDGAKVNTQVAIPTILDLDSYRDIDNDDSMRYELTAVIKHLGNLNQGHYICSAKASDNQWYHFDDRKKSVGTVSEAISGSKNSFSPYILFYQRKEE